MVEPWRWIAADRLYARTAFFWGESEENVIASGVAHLGPISGIPFGDVAPEAVAGSSQGRRWVFVLTRPSIPGAVARPARSVVVALARLSKADRRRPSKPGPSRKFLLEVVRPRSVKPHLARQAGR